MYSFQIWLDGWPGSKSKSWILIGSPGLLLFFNQNDVVLIKKNKSQQVSTGFLTGSRRVFPFSIFSSTRLGSSSGLTRRARPDFKTIIKSTFVFFYNSCVQNSNTFSRRVINFPTTKE